MAFSNANEVNNDPMDSTIDSATAVLIMLHAIGGIESWHRSKKRISARELEDNMLTILVGGLRKNH